MEPFLLIRLVETGIAHLKDSESRRLVPVEQKGRHEPELFGQRTDFGSLIGSKC